MKQYYFVFDVESRGLHGEGFAYGAALLDDQGAVVGTSIHACLVEQAGRARRINGVDPEADDRWLIANVLPRIDHECFDLEDPRMVRVAFFLFLERAYEIAGRNGASLVIAADCPYPVETTFLWQVATDNRLYTMAAGKPLKVYPLIDVASVLLAYGYDPVATYPRLAEQERPAHNPLADALHSGRILFTLLSDSELRPEDLPKKESEDGEK